MGFRREAPLAIICLVLGTALLAACIPGPKGVEVEFSSVEPTQGVEVLVPDQNLEVPLGKTPFRAPVDLEPGSYTYIASAPGYHPLTGEFTIGQGQQSVQVWIPRMQEAGGEILVHSSATAEIAINGSTVGDCEANTWTSYGHFAPGEYTVQATTPLGSQEQIAVVAETASGRVQFTWGSRLIISVEPSEILSLTLAVDGAPYTGPMEISAEEMNRKAFVQVAASAPGYQPWADVVFLTAGGMTNVEVSLKEEEVTTGPTPAADFTEKVLAAYWRMWEVWNAAAKNLDPSPLVDVMTGTLLDRETQGFEAMAGLGIASWSVSASPHTPTVAMVSEVTATVAMEADIESTTVQQDGSSSTRTDHWVAECTFVLGDDGVWRAAGWESTAAVGPSPTGVAGTTPGAGGTPTGRPEPANRAMVSQIILASMNCVRQDQGWQPVVWDQQIADVLGPFAEQATREYQQYHTYPPATSQAAREALADLGATGIGWWGIELSYSASTAAWGYFAFDWENYVSDPCATGYAQYWGDDPATASLTRVGMAIGTPYWDGDVWYATIIIAGR